jgi:1-acyl-sn-glycerol-3-phosphate acyltransferase
VARIISRRVHFMAIHCFYRACLKVVGVRLNLQGSSVCKTAPVLFISNHVSYLDIVALGSFLNASFISKKDVAGWPFFGQVARLNRTVFVERRRDRAAGEMGVIGQRLREKDSLVLFPEGTTGNGSNVLRFKSTFFKLAEDWKEEHKLYIQPVSLAYTHLNNVPMGTAVRRKFAWIGDADLASHLWMILKQGAITISVKLHPPFPAHGMPRKELALQLHDIISVGMADLTSGKKIDANFEKLVYSPAP